MPAPLPLHELRAADLRREEVLFTHGAFLYLTTGKTLGEGGMGAATVVKRRPLADRAARAERVVAKTYRDELYLAYRHDAEARRHFEHALAVIERVRGLRHPNLLPVLLSAPIADNHLLVTPLGGESLYALLGATVLSPRERVRLVVEALQGLGALHDAGVVHRDFTLHNVLTLAGADGTRHAALFDFDIAVAPALLPPDARSYRAHYAGRVAGSPDLSVAPELLDDALGDEPVSPRADVYAVGTALYGVFTDDSVYGEVPDLATLLYRIAEGVVRGGDSRVAFPRDVPQALRPLVTRCLERHPAERFADAGAVLRALKDASTELSARRARAPLRMSTGFVRDKRNLRLQAAFTCRRDRDVTRAEIDRADRLLGRHGYLLEQSLGRVKGHAIYLAAPAPPRLPAGRLPEDNPYRKVVTLIDLRGRADGAAFAETWLARAKPIVDRVRQGFLTSLSKAVHDRDEEALLLMSEWVDDPRFGTDLAQHDLPLDEVFALGLTLAAPVRALHAAGLAHNNITAASVLFKGRRDAGTVQPLLVGLVEPSFEPEARARDVRYLAALVLAHVRPARLEALHGEAAVRMIQVRDRLARAAAGGKRAPGVDEVAATLADGLALLHPNYDVLRASARADGGADERAYVDLVIQRALYHRLFAGTDAAASGR